MADPLLTLIKMRKRACDEAQRSLVTALDHENQAEQATHRVERQIAQETEAASDIDTTDAMVEAFAAWLPAARRELFLTRQRLVDRQAETMRSRAELAACRTALETVETLVQERRDATRRAIDLLYAQDLEDRPVRDEEGDDQASNRPPSGLLRGNVLDEDPK